MKFKKKMDCTILVAKVKAALFSHNADCLFSDAVAQLLKFMI